MEICVVLFRGPVTISWQDLALRRESGRDFLETEIRAFELMNQSEVTRRVELIPSPWGEGEGEGDRDMHKQQAHPIRGCNRGRFMERTAALSSPDKPTKA